MSEPNVKPEINRKITSVGMKPSRDSETLELVDEARLRRLRPDCRLQLSRWTAVAADQSSHHYTPSATTG